jgi:aspartyl-tRNA synthetase
MQDWRRTHHCGELRAPHTGNLVRLNGWVNAYRGYGQQVFLDLRDRHGITQVVVEANDTNLELYKLADSVGREWCLAVEGKVRARLPGKENTDLATGAIEVEATEIVVLNQCPTPPFEVTEFPGEEIAGEDLRLEKRYLDLRRPSLQKTLVLRHTLNRVIREYLSERGFLELETPLLGRSTPEGARDYLVPSRVHPGSWYALPQSPQLYKQLLMIAGYDRYFQIARCLRDEDLRADRQPEFTQLDLEMSFVDQDDVLGMIEGLSKEILKVCRGVDISLPIRRMGYDEAMLRYGSDKPDTRFGLEIEDLCEWAKTVDFRVFKEVIASGGVVRAIHVSQGASKFSNTDLKPGGKLSEVAVKAGAKGLAWLKYEDNKFLGGIEKFFSAEAQDALKARFGIQNGDLLLMVADKEDTAAQVLGTVRLHLANVLGLLAGKEDTFEILWIVDFPSFMHDPEAGRHIANHHPFTAPRVEDIAHLDTDPSKVRARAYDLVINGYEVGGGSIRIHDPVIQSKVFSVLGLSPEQAQEKFGFLLDALKHGAPPHGGIALGLDRWAMIIAGTSNIRDVIAFPKNQRARDMMTGAPAPVEPKQLKDLGL